MAASIDIRNIFFQPQQRRHTKKPPWNTTLQPTPDDLFNIATELVESSYCDLTPTIDLSETEAPPGAIPRREYQDANAFQSCYPYDAFDNTFLRSVPRNYDSLRLDNPTSAAEHHTIFDHPFNYNSDLLPHTLPAGGISNSSTRGLSPRPGSSSASRSRAERRGANTLAARRYRQNRLNKVAELESALKATQVERDALKVQVAKLEGETRVLKDIVNGTRVETC
ncbi:MAG: hypothetical protein M1817_004596 [Caeruleum heppii]|nr:MAG: hypothetical protein M1817_004596 [Caeruleum heppii]